MAQPDQAAQQAATDADRFVRMITAGRRDGARRVVENDAYLRMVLRIIRGLEARACGDHMILPQVLAVGQRLDEVVNVAIAVNSTRYKVNPHAGASAGECAAVLGMTKQSAGERAAKGRQIIARRLADGGGVDIEQVRRRRSEAAREAATVTAAAQFAVTQMDAYRARHRRSA